MTAQTDRRLKVNFMTLDAKQENQIISALMDYLIWYKDNQALVDKEIKKNGEDINDTSIVDFWIARIGKPEAVEKYLQDIHVVADCYEFVKKYKERILILKDAPEKWVFTKNHYRTHEQAKEMKRLLSELQNHVQVQKILDFMHSHHFDEDHISADYAEKIIRTCNNLRYH